MNAAIQSIESYLPAQKLTNAELAEIFPEWSAEKIQKKTGICERRIAAKDQCASDLAVSAAQRLFASGACLPEDIDYLLFCTQSPDYLLPTTACLVQHRLGLRTNIGALDFNLGCSGFVYGLSLAKGLIASEQASRVLLITSETYSKFIHPRDKSVRVLFGDGAAATLITRTEEPVGSLGPFVVGTDGSGAENLIVRRGGLRAPHLFNPDTDNDDDDNYLFMNGPEIFYFTMQAVPELVKRLLDRSQMSLDDVDLFVFHQANKYMLDHLRRKLKIPEQKFSISMQHCGNTVSSSIPLALQSAIEEGRLSAGQRVMLVGFGVGYSFAATMLEWSSAGEMRLPLGRSA